MNGCKLGQGFCCENFTSVNENMEIIAYLQPIVSLKHNSIIGFESLCRGLCKQCGRIIPPNELFSKITEENNLFELDLLARKAALKAFKKLVDKNKNLLLFINLDVSLVEKEIEVPESILDIVKEYEISPCNVVVEITETKPCNLDILYKFMSKCKEFGFLIALDDVGTGYSNFDRILTIKPNILKIDRSIISDINKNYHKKAVFRSLTRLAKKTGIFILAEGTETEEEVLYTVELGAQLLQGFYFAKPCEINDDVILDINEKIEIANDKSNQDRHQRINQVRDKNNLTDAAINDIAKALSVYDIENTKNINNILAQIISQYHFIESGYIIDKNGIQKTDTVFSREICLRPTLLFKPKNKGSMHYHKDYFYYVQNGPFNKYSTDTFISLSTGHLCRTLSLEFEDKVGNYYIISLNVTESK